MSENLYTILGVSETASADELKRAYRKKAMEYHPDRHGGDKQKEAMFKKLNEAYQILSDDAKRARYDQFWTVDDAGAGFSGAGFSDLGDIFESFFGGGFGGSRRKQTGIAGEDIQITLDIAFEEIFEGTKKTIEFTKMQACDGCDGSGAKKGTTPKECDTCGGQGQVRQRAQSIFWYTERVGVCPTCDGSGKVITDPCDICHGKKRTETPVSQEIDVPAGIDTEMTIRLSGEWHEGVGAPNGDVYVTFRVENEKDGLVRDELNLYYTVTIDPVEAVLGSEQILRLAVLWERKLQIRPGTAHGAEIRYKHDGVRHVQRDTKGDLIVTLKIDVPKKLSKKERELYEQLAKEKDIIHPDKKGVFGSLFS